MTARAADLRVIFVMAGAAREAERIARTLVEEKLAACVNMVGPVHSIYRWRGAIEQAKEHLLIIKTRQRLYPQLERRVRELHSYEVPEIIALAPTAGLRPYLEWIIDSTTTVGKTRKIVAPR
jgi:periplasmic divalent cation tolerance protein